MNSYLDRYLHGEHEVVWAELVALGSCGFFLFDEGFHRAEMGYELRRAS